MQQFQGETANVLMIRITLDTPALFIPLLRIFILFPIVKKQFLIFSNYPCGIKQDHIANRAIIQFDSPKPGFYVRMLRAMIDETTERFDGSVSLNGHISPINHNLHAVIVSGASVITFAVMPALTFFPSPAFFLLMFMLLMTHQITLVITNDHTFGKIDATS
jgi:hypothetical protein